MNRAEAEQYLSAVAEAMQTVWDKYGWLQGELGNDDQGYCLRGCWYRATGQMDGSGCTNVDLTLDWAFTQSFKRACQTLFNQDWYSPEGFNDDLRSEEDVRLIAKHTVMGMSDLMVLADA